MFIKIFLIVMVVACMGFSKEKPFVSKAPYYMFMINFTKDKEKRRMYYDSLMVVLEDYHKRIGVK